MSCMQPLAKCPVCGTSDFSSVDVLWPELINAWQLAPEEVAYINRQQGYHCANCKNNLRAMGLAAAIMEEFGFDGIFLEFCTSRRKLKVLEINRAGQLTQCLSKMPSHRLVEYPEFDMQCLALESGGFDLVVHSDTLEHVQDPIRGLSECHRVLRSGGKCMFTVPIVVDRMTRNTAGLRASYHGESGLKEEDQRVYSEFGCDLWKDVLRAGFKSSAFVAFEYPAALTIVASK